MSLAEKTLAVSAINNGTVIDHIQAGCGIKIVKMLNLCSYNKPVSLGLNLPSKSLELKDLIKIEGRKLTPEEANKVAIFSPHATINIIEDYNVATKFKVTVPDLLENVITCTNSHCISNHVQAPHILKVIRRQRDTIRLECHYCRKSFTQEEIK